MNYTLNQLHIFMKIVETNSVTRASEELHLTQPAVSIQLKNFQDQFDIPLTEVIGRKLHITDFGREIASAAERILEQVYAINYKTMAYKGLLTGRLKIAVASTGKYVMPYFLSEFINDNPGIDLVMDVNNKTRVIESLVNNQVDFALVSIIPPGLQVHQIDLLPNRLFLTGKNPISGDILTDAGYVLKNLTWIFREEGSATRSTLEHFLSSNDIEVRRKIELTSNEAVKQALLAGLGYSLMSLMGIKSELKNGELTITPLKGLPVVTTWSLIWLKGKKLAPASDHFLTHLMAHKNEIISQNFSWAEELLRS